MMGIASCVFLLLRKTDTMASNRKAVSPAIDMGALQNEVANAKRDAKAKAKSLQAAHEADVAAKARLAAAVEAFTNASRAVMAG